MGERLAGGNVAVALLANTLATGGALLAIISALQPISGAHFNPVVTVVDAAAGGLPGARCPSSSPRRWPARCSACSRHT